jgi:hypothetical protein
MKLLLLSFLLATSSLHLRSLKNVATKSLDISGKKPVFYMVFQEDCSACHQQVKKLSCLNVPIYLIGAFSSEPALRKEYKKMKTSYAGYLATPQDLKALGVSAEITPQSFLFLNNKKYHFSGLTSCEEIKRQITKESE